MNRIIILLLLFVFNGSFSIWAQVKFQEQHFFRNDVFIANNGQFFSWTNASENVHYAVTNGAEMFQFTSTGVNIRTCTITERIEKEEKRESRNEREREEAGEHRPTIHESFATMRWIGSNPQAVPEPSDKESSYVTYVLKTASGEMKGVKSEIFRKITYRNLYPGIDIEYFIPQKGGIKYNVIVHPGADPSQVKISYSGNVSRQKLNSDGSFTVFTPDGPVTEHAPVALRGDGIPVKSAFKFENNVLSFIFPAGYDATQKLIIDPWVVTGLTNLSTSQKGFSVRHDNFGNLFVYGGGDPNGSGTPAYQTAKYSPTGVLLWTFNGVLVAPAWTSSGVSFFAPGNILVDRTTGKTYVGQAYSNLGTQLIRLDAAGAYDNFISAQSPTFEENWDFVFDCNFNQVYAMGGGTTSNINMGVVNTITGAVTSSNITSGPASNIGEDIVSTTIDPSGNVYCLFACGMDPNVNNHIYRVNSTFNGNVWNTASGYMSFTEGNNRPYFPASNFFTGNGHNALAANANYVYYYDGFNLKAFFTVSGTAAGTPTTIAGYTPLFQGGIAVDECNNIYVGGVGQIHIYTFNGSVFTPAGTISLGASLSLASVYDVRYDMATHSLFVSGDNFVGVYSATASLACNTINISTASSCSGTAVTTVTTNISNPVFTYTWYDSNGNVVGTTTGTTSFTDSITGLPSGNYTVIAQINPLCGGPLAIDSFSTNSLPLSLSNVTHVSCNGLTDGSATVNVLSGSPPYTYGWNTTPAQNTATAANLGPGNYTCTVSDTSGCTSNITVTITQPQVLSATSSNDTSLCGGNNLLLWVNPTGGTSPYSVIWSTGGPPSDTAAVSPVTTTTYGFIVTDSSGCTFADSITVTVSQSGTAALAASPDGCVPWPVQFTDLSTAPGSVTITSWQWDFGDGNFSTLQNPNHTYTTAGSYSVTLVVTFSNGCTSNAALSTLVNIYNSPVASFSYAELGGGQVQFTDLSVNATTWQWSFGDANSSTQQNPLHTYDLMLNNGGMDVQLIVTNSFGCADTATQRIEVRDFIIYIPNTFTPDGNGNNDGFTAYGIGIEKFEMYIFDRWGMLLYTSNNMNQPWDGTFKGNPVQIDTYVYKINVIDVFSKQHNYIGHVNVLR
ncbi:MAG: PKD domain-containing protein [Bacteroidia bacterium]|jgi:gliding motility-associated-like protein|nr:PKD domain-containing protein [Bacteroidia bacterium]